MSVQMEDENERETLSSIHFITFDFAFKFFDYLFNFFNHKKSSKASKGYYLYRYAFISKMFTRQLLCGKNCTRKWRIKNDNSGT